jgi:hypothetical protein
MNDHQKENASRIALYLENRLSPEEREAFKRALGEDDELRLQYVDALMNRAGTATNPGGTEEPVTATEIPGETVEPVTGTENSGGSGGPAGDAFEKEMSVLDDPGAAGVGELDEAARGASVGEREEMPEEDREVPVEAGGKKGARGGFLGSRWMVGVAALLLITAGVVIFIMIGRGGFLERTDVATTVDSSNTNRGNGIDSAAGKAGNSQVGAGKGADSAASGAGAASGVAGGGTGVGAAVAGGKERLADSLYARLYKPYMRGDDPVEVRGYYRDYRTGNYAAVLAAGDSAVKRAGPRGLLIRDYMRLYVGLSYLTTDDGRNAVRELEGVVLRTKPGDILYENGRWYLALAWLKRNDVDAAQAKNKALGLAREIAHSYSRYREAAGELVRALGQ